jgi:hypothetical protein
VALRHDMKTFSISGSVKAANGAPVPGASVLIAEGPGPAPDIAALSNDAGTFTLDGLSEGTYIVRAFGPAGHEGRGETSVLIRAKNVKDAEIVLKAA